MKWIIAFTASLFLATASFAADAPKPAAKSFIDSITVSPYGVVRWPDLDGNPNYGAGVDVSVAVNSFVRVHVLNTAYETENWGGGSSIDETSLLVSADITRFKTEAFTPYFIGGGVRDWDREDWGFQAGAGGRLNFNKNFSVGADYSIRAWFNNDKDGVLRGYVSLSF